MTVKLAAGMIVLNGDFVLKQCLEQLYPHMDQILIAEGPVKFFQDKGLTTSTDQTNEILENFPDPDNKITIVHGQFSEKDEQCNAYMKHLRDDIDYLINVDSDEVYKSEDLIKLKGFLEPKTYTSIGVRSISFYGGFQKYIGGFELQTDNFLRIFRVTPGCKWLTHRPPTIQYPTSVQKRHLNSDTFYDLTGIQMYHYSYVFPDQVYNKIQYYKAKVSMDRCIDNYFNSVYLPWVMGSSIQKDTIEELHNGVHEFKPEMRMHTRTETFNEAHPEAIQRDLPELVDRITKELEKYYV